MLTKHDRKDTQLMFTGTDSHLYEIKTDEVYKDLFQGKELFDNINYSKTMSSFLMKIRS